ncbi:MAG: hypothetical protein ABFC24_06755 [Methanoregulaceae archaeon]
MQKKQGRKYQVVEDAEIDLVLQCRESGEFYDRYYSVFPHKNKDLDSLSRIWKRRSEFAKKRQITLPSAEIGKKPAGEIRALIVEQTKLLAGISALTQENLAINREILAALTLQNQLLSGQPAHTERKPQRVVVSHVPPEKVPIQKKVPRKITPIMVGS